VSKKSTATAPQSKDLSKSRILAEIAWEVCNQVGGIYTVIRSKVPVMIDKWGDNYLLLGPYVDPNVSADFELIENYDGPIGNAVERMKKMGF